MASLHVAVLFGDENLTRTLLEEGYDANTYDERLGTPLSIAILKGHRPIVKLLSENGADHNNQQFTSALIHSRIHEFNISANLDFGTLNSDNRDRLRGSVSQDRREDLSPDRQSVSDSVKLQSDGSEAEDLRDINRVDTSIGSVSETKFLYKNESKWEEAPPRNLKTMHMGAITSVEGLYERYAVVEYMDHHDEGGWLISKLDIHGFRLCGFLSRVLEDYPEANVGHTRTTLYPDMQGKLDPCFIGLFHRMELYIKLSEDEDDHMTQKQAKLLLKRLKLSWSPVQYVVKESRATGLVAWKSLWTIFRPGEIAIYREGDENNNEQSAAKILEIELVPEHWVRPPIPVYLVTLEVLDWNGSYSGYRKIHRQIPEYEGFKKVIDLPLYPLSYESDPEEFKERLVQRGGKFESLRGCFFMARRKFNATRRVIIDNYAYHRFHGGDIPSYRRMGDQSSVSEDNVETTIHGAQPMENQRNEDLRSLTADECLLCVLTMKGFDVKEKEWHDVRVDCLENIEWNEEALDYLTMNEDRKRLILAFARQKQIETTEFDDFISGKGKGFIILLCGPPGVGKTLTAESVAERIKAPLYTLSAGDLGTNAASVERSLKKALEMCALWKAVMLIDEADVFLEARKTDNLERNELVSVFLRLLEYYKGILFLTTNRASTIDAAFESRIDFILPYDDFDQAARRQVWVNFANTLIGGNHELHSTDFDELSQLKLNGRQIKNTVKTALMLANSEERILQMEHLKIVLNVRQQATNYIGDGAQITAQPQPRPSDSKSLWKRLRNRGN
ncbi:hypothetical protein ABKA04_009762 [Annulohypoxylon sp. FPYF3050]